MTAALLGRDEETGRILERAHHAHLEAGDPIAAARVAIWTGFRLIALLGEGARGNGWLGRAKRLLEESREDCVERGYLLLPAVKQHLDLGNYESARACAAEAARIGERFGDADLIAFGRFLQGQAFLREERIREGLALIDEAMVAVTAGELSPLITGILYCNVIRTCQDVYALSRAREWTDALKAWCDEQPSDVSFSGSCLIHRSEILQWKGEWSGAMEEARRAADRLLAGSRERYAAGAFYQQAELHRLRGEFAQAEAAYASASRWGSEPQPGLALLRLAQGRIETAASAMRRALAAASSPTLRLRLLPAHVEIMLAAGDLEEARRGARALEEAAQRLDVEVLEAMAAHARGSVDLAEGNAKGALEPLRRSFEIWQKLRAPYLAARVRVLIGPCVPGSRGPGRLPPRVRCRGRDSPAARRGAGPRRSRSSGEANAPAADGTGAPGASTHRRGEDEQGDRRGALPLREDRGPARQQHLRQARCPLPRRGDGVRLRARVDLGRGPGAVFFPPPGPPRERWRGTTWGEFPIELPSKIGGFFRRGLAAPRPNLRADEKGGANELESGRNEGGRSPRRGICFFALGGRGGAFRDPTTNGALRSHRHRRRSGGPFRRVLPGQGRGAVRDPRRKRAVGDSWRRRWDSLRLFSPAEYDGLVGVPFPAPPRSFPTKDEMADYLESYAKKFALPVRNGVRVKRLFRDGNRYVVVADGCRFEASQVVVAMANYQKPRIPSFAADLDEGILQLQSSDYRNPSQLREGGVLVVGAGNSGAEIALEIARRQPGVPVFLSGRHPGHIPFRVESPAVQRFVVPLLFRVVFHRLLSLATPLGRKARPGIISKGTPLIRVKPADLDAAGVRRVPRVAGTQEGKALLADGRTLGVANVIWAIGFDPGFSWIELPVFDGHGEPRQVRGVAEGEPGLYFVGLHFLYAMSSSMIHGVARDARHVVDAVIRRLRRASPRAAARLGSAARPAEARS